MDERPDQDERAARLEARRHMGASRSRWTQAEGWTTPPEDRTPWSPAPRRRRTDLRLPVVILVVLVTLAWALVVLAEMARLV